MVGLIAFLLAARPYAAEEGFQDIVVEEGATLWGIANRYLKDPKRWPDIVKHNDLRTSDPTVALPGTKIRVPVLLIKEEYRNAQLIKMIPEVRYKRKDGTQWKQADPNMTLNYADSLRTMSGARARVRFPSDEVVQINENTYVVLKPERILQEVELLKGEVRASRAKIITPQGTVVEPRGARSDYQAKIREDDTEVVFVYKGKVEVTAQGKTVTVHEGYGTEVPKFSAPKPPAPLTSFKDFNPAEMAVAAPNGPTGAVKPRPQSRRKTPRARSKTIASHDILVSYRLELAKDKTFEKIAFQKTDPIGSTFDIGKADIPDGNYWMRVAFIDAFGVRGPFSRPSTITKDTVAPKISNVSPRDGQRFSGEESYCDIIGDVEGAAVVAVNGEVVFIGPTGRFSKFFPLSEGSNKITIAARDIHGNETVVERTVTYSK